MLKTFNDGLLKILNATLVVLLEFAPLKEAESIKATNWKIFKTLTQNTFMTAASNVG